METATDNLKHFYDEWLNTQKQFAHNWLESAQNFQKAMTGQAAGTEPATQAFQNLANQQNELYRNWVENMRKVQQQMPFPTPWSGGAQASAIPGFGMDSFNAMREMMEQQLKAYRSLWNTPANGNGQSADVFGAWSGLRTDTAARVFALYESWRNLGENYLQLVARNQEEIGKHMNNPVAKEALQGLFNSTESYMKVLEFWMPIYKRMQEKSLDYEQLQQMLSPERYKEVMDCMFEFASPETVQEFYGQFARMTESVAGTTQNALKRYNELMQRNTRLMPDLMAGDPQAAMKIYENMYEAYQKNLDPSLKAVIAGRDADVIEAMKEISGKYSDYTNTLAKYQYKVYVTGQKAMEKAARHYFEQYEKSGEVRSFNDFFKTWSETNQAAFQEIFRTEEFNQLQHDVTAISHDIKHQFQRLIELYMADYPVVPRSEMESVYQTVHELKEQVRQLQAALNTNGAAAPAADEADKPAGRKPVAAKK